MAHDANAHLDTAAADSGALSQYQKESEKGAANGYASLDGSTLIPDAQIPATIARDSELHAQAHSNTDHTDASPDFHRMKSGLYYSSGNFSSNVGPVLDELRLGHFAVAKTVTVDRIGIWCNAAVALSVSRLGIYRDDGNGYPGARVLDAGTVDTSTTGFKEITISQQLIPDLYWVGGVAQVIVTALTIATLAVSSGQFSTVGSAAAPATGSPTNLAGFAEPTVSGALPANFTTTKANGLPMRVWLRAA